VPILIGGESDHTLRRIAQLADGWLPRARHGFDAEKEMARLQNIAEREHRDPGEISTTIFGAPGDPAVLESYRQAGVDRAIIMLRSESSDVVCKRLESIAAELNGQFL
jgi:alkanesulfonate monooxygenase SsuD/methylene tetrahydromethanopterin reductase-like flavin-dependent oxidoreductase (luciferase family)